MFWSKKKRRKRSRPDLEAAVKKAERESKLPDFSFDETTDVIDITLAHATAKMEACQQKAQKAADTLKELRTIRLPEAGPSEKLG